MRFFSSSVSRALCTHLASPSLAALIGMAGLAFGGTAAHAEDTVQSNVRSATSIVDVMTEQSLLAAKLPSDAQELECGPVLLERALSCRMLRGATQQQEYRFRVSLPDSVPLLGFTYVRSKALAYRLRFDDKANHATRIAVLSSLPDFVELLKQR